MLNRQPSGEEVHGDLKVRWGTVSRGEPVHRHAHPGGHFTTVIGHVLAVCGDEEFEVVDRGFYVPPGVAHRLEWKSGPAARYTCVGMKDF